uniref:MFS domain-containing protein n=1 Tax=Globodera pallida TaxID=36090 RepID=A0A183CKY3_GLOPA
MQYGPIYLNKTLKFDVERTGFAVALPSLLSLLAKFIVGPASDYATFLSDRARVIFFATLSQFLMALCFCALALLPSDSPRWLLQMCFTAVTVVCGINCAGVGKSALLISSQYAPVVSTFSVFACSCTIILIPVLVSVLAPDNEPSQWSRIFLIAAAVILCCLFAFDCTAEASPRPWTTFDKRSSKDGGAGAGGGNEDARAEAEEEEEELGDERTEERTNKGKKEEEALNHCITTTTPRGTSSKQEQHQLTTTTTTVNSSAPSCC